MAIEKFNAISEAWSSGLEKEDLILNPQYGPKIAEVLFVATSNCLSSFKTKDHPTALVFEELNGNFLLAAVVEYHAGKTAKDPGNWSYVWTFNKEDVPDNAKIYHIQDTDVKPYFRSYSVEKYKFSVDEKSMPIVYLFMVKMIGKWLDDNVVENDINGVELDGVFQARVGIEDGAVVKSIEPVGEIKVLIKDDAAIEK